MEWDVVLQVQQVGASWASALGTLAAAGAAVWLGVRDILERRNRRHLEEEVLGKFIVPECEAAICRLQCVITELDRLVDFSVLGTTSGALRAETVRTVVVQTSIRSVEGHISQLPMFGLQRGNALARAAGNMNVLRQLLAEVAAEPSATIGSGMLQRSADRARRLARDVQKDLRLGIACADNEFQALIGEAADLIVEPSARYLDMQRRDLGPMGFQRRE